MEGTGFRGVTEWEAECCEPVWIPSTTRFTQWLGRFAARLSLPLHHGRQWRISTHQGRKIFARFVALRDRTSLFALAQHLGHRDRAITDTGYVGTDYALQREIEAEVLEQSIAAWEHMLSVPDLGGRAGAELVAKRPRFCGRSMKQDLKSYARLLVGAGLTLGVCDWGFCVYREEYSACRGDAFGRQEIAMNTTPDTALAESADKSSATHAILQLRGENMQLREQLAKLAALVDHYCGAYWEAKSLVERRERELGVSTRSRRRFDTKPADEGVSRAIAFTLD